MVWFFIFMAAVAFLAFANHARHRNGHGMAFALFVFAAWVAAALWWSGRLG